jgi:hypothetical protein
MQVIINSRFRGPPDSANGGYIGQRVDIGGEAEVSLRRPAERAYSA